jgi:hypothetical protein
VKVKFRQSGGIVGVPRGCELDSASLPAAQARKLARLVKAAGLDEDASHQSPAARDASQYEITVEHDDGRPAHVRADDATAPEALWPLLEFLQTCATPQPLRKK